MKLKPFLQHKGKDQIKDFLLEVVMMLLMTQLLNVAKQYFTHAQTIFLFMYIDGNLKLIELKAMFT